MRRFAVIGSSFFLSAILLSIEPGVVFAQSSTQQPIKAFILVGQSNMQGHAHVRTLQHLASRDATRPVLVDYIDANGKARVHDQVDISSLSSNGVTNGKLTTGFGANEEKIGPELSFGVTMHKLLGEPILIIKAAWGGKSLHTDFRPPSAGPFVFSEGQLKRFEEQKKDIAELKKKKVEATGHYYRLMLEHVKSIIASPEDYSTLVANDQKVELAGFVWFQGWNDMVDGGVYPQRGKPGGYDDYSNLLAHFIRDVRSDLSVPELPFVVGVMGVGGPTAQYGKDQQRHKATHQSFRDAMAAPASMPEFKGNVQAVLTEEFWDTDLGQLVNRRDKLNNELRRKVRNGDVARDQQKAEREKMLQQEFTKKETELLELGVSNAAYHYLGSAKIMLGIGEGFAGSMAQMLQSQQKPSVSN